jgi:sugar phosphate isomerase/epimerase
VRHQSRLRKANAGRLAPVQEGVIIASGPVTHRQIVKAAKLKINLEKELCPLAFFVYLVRINANTMNSRRQFLKSAAATVAGAALAGDVLGEILKKKGNVGVQLFTIPSMVAADFKGTLSKLATIGYKEIEFFGPYDFSAPETIEGWKRIAPMLGITKNAFYGYTPTDVKSMLKDVGLSTPSAHLDLITMRKNMSAAMDGLSTLGVKYVAIPAINNPDDRSDFNKLADEFNSFGEQMKKSGITFVYHNHGYEHAEKDGKVLMDTLLTQTDSNNVKFELDIFWMAAAGASPIEYLKKYPGRFKLLHIKDASEPIRFSGDGGSPDQWMPLFGKMADPGSGIFDIPGIIDAAKKSGVDHFYLERDLTPDPEKTLNNSFAYLSKVR